MNQQKSGTFITDPEERTRSLVLRLVAQALDAYRDAAKARDVDGDDASADVLCAAADRAMVAVNETIEELATT